MTCVEIKKPAGPKRGADDAAGAAAQGRQIPDQGRGTGVNRPTSPSAPASIRHRQARRTCRALEAAGTVAALARASRWKVGDALCALTPGGSYAEYCIRTGAACLPPPKGFDMRAQARCRRIIFTVWHNLSSAVSSRRARAC